MTRLTKLRRGEDYDPPLTYHLSDRLRDDRTYYMVIGLYLLVGGSMGVGVAKMMGW